MAFTSETARLAGRKGSRNGVKNQKTVAWETLSESITRQHAEKFNEYMNNLWRGDDNDKFKAAQLYLKTLDFFKPKMSRITTDGDNEMTIRVIHES